MAERKYAIAVPNYGEHFNIPGPYFGDLVFEHLEKLHPGKFERIEMVVRGALDSSEEVQIEDHVRDRDVYVIHPCIVNAAQHVMVAQEISDNLHRSDVHNVILFDLYNRYFSYDKRKMKQSLNAKIVADNYEKVHIDRVFTFDAHSQELVLAFSLQCPLEPLPMTIPLGNFFRKHYPLDNFTVCSPDIGGYARAEVFADFLDLPLIGIRKRRAQEQSDSAKALEIVGERKYVEGKKILFRDEVIRSGGSLEEAANMLREAGAEEFYAAVTHLELCGNAIDKIKRNGIKVIGTNTIAHEFGEKDKDHFNILDVSPLIAEVTYRRSEGLSIREFFSYTK